MSNRDPERHSFPRGIFVIPWRNINWQEVADFLNDNGVNTVSLSIKDSQGLVFYPSSIAPHISLDDNKMREGIEIFHKKGINVKASLASFADMATAQTHPEWLAVTADGIPARPQRAWNSWTEAFYYHHCPNRPEYQSYLLNIINEVVSRYEIDGIDLDFIRYPYIPSIEKAANKYFCYCDYCLQTFQQQTGENAKSLEENTPEWIAWINWRSEKLGQFLAQVKETIKQHSDLKLMTYIATYGSNTCDKDELKIIQQKYGQDLTRMAETVDIFAPMLYHVFTEEVSYTRQNVFWIKSMTHWITEIGKDVWTVVHGDDPLSEVELESAIQNAVNGGASGIIIYPGRSWRMNKLKWERIRETYFALG